MRKCGIPVLLAESAGTQWKAWCCHCVKFHLLGAGEGHVWAHCIEGPFLATGYYLKLRVGG
jgi:hypothetical protein